MNLIFNHGRAGALPYRIAFVALFLAIAATCGAQQTTVPAPTPWAITSRSANSRIWQQTTYELSPSGQTVPHLHQYTELGTGICYQQLGGDGQWLDSQDVINILPDGTASATNGLHQAYFPIDIHDGTINLITPDGLQMQSQPVGLFYDDGTNIALISSLTNSTGSLVTNNVVIYQNAFMGIDADLRYTYRKSGFEQEIVINRQLPTPEAFGLSSASANLELITEFAAPEPTQSATVSGPNGLSDVILSFDSMKMVRGKAFSIGGSSSTNLLPGEITVYKSWQHVGNEQLLLEALPFEQIAPNLSRLPALSSAIKMRARPVKRALMARILPRAHSRQAVAHRKRMAAASWHYRSGVVLDYQLVNGSITNYTFQSDLTYYISSYTALYGTNNVFEGGAVLKYAAGCYGLVVEGSSSGPSVKTLTGTARPVIFTAVDDNSVGTAITNSSGNPKGYYANIALDLGGASSSWDVLKNLRISYAETGIQIGQETAQFSDVQLMNCGVGCSAGNGAAVTFENALFGNDQYDFNLDLSDAYATNATFSGSASTNSSLTTGNGNLYVANCILANVTNTSSASGDHNGFYNTSAFGSPSLTISTNPFETVGGGSYYLSGNTFRTNATPNVEPTLLADLAQKTTWAPVVYSNALFSIVTNLGPQAARESTNAPDLGYAYDPLDYVFGGCDVDSNMTVSAGTAIGWFQGYGRAFGGGEPYSISLNDTAVWSLNGTATQPCYYANYAMVQEGGNGVWTNSGNEGSIVLNGGGTTTLPRISANFTKWTYYSAQGILEDATEGGNGYFKNCEFYSTAMSSYNIPNLAFTNCLFFRNNLNFWTSPSLSFVNSTFYNGCLSMYRSTSVFWLIENSAFDGTMFAWQDSYNGTNHAFIHYNAYDTNNFSWTNYPYGFPPVYGFLETNVFNDNVFVSNFDWESSFFGSFYQPTNSGTFHAGSVNANLLGLYWFTTQTNQTVEGTNQATIGYSYVATDTNGNPLNMCGGTPYYILYPNGPGTNFLEIVTNPASLTVTQGDDASFSVVAEGAPLPLSYQWYWDGSPLSDGPGVSGSESAILNLIGVNPDQQGDYYAVVSNSFACAASSNATLTVVQTGVSSVTNFPYPQYVLTPGSYWNVTDISDPGQPVNIGALEAPFSETDFDNGNFDGNGIYLPNTLWHTNTTVIVTNSYGTTEFGGISNKGTVFEIGLTGGISTIYTFTNVNGAYPCSQLAISGNTYYGIPNTLYGTTLGGGSNGYGTVFKLNGNGGGFTNLYNFAGTSDGEFPKTGLLIDGNTLYGTTSNSIFKINTDGSDFTCLTNVTNASQLTLSLSGETLYGATYSGGVSNEGTLFSINTDGSGFTNFYTFTGGTSGAFPTGGLELYEVGNFLALRTTMLTLFGTTYSGGASNLGMVFSINIDGSDFTDLHDFTGINDGAYPVGGLLITNNNVDTSQSSIPLATTYMYGTTSAGGASNCGTIFGIGTNGSNFQTVYSFRGTNGANPEGKLVSTIQALYGTTAGGSVHNSGAAFKINFDGSDFTNLYDFPTNSGTACAGLALPVVDNWASIWSLDATINASSNNVSNLVYSVAFDNFYALYVNGIFVTNNSTTSVNWLWPPSSLAPYLHPGDNDVRVIIGGDDDMNDYFAMVIRDASYNTVFTNLYGTTSEGGTGSGTIFEIMPGGYETNLYSFSGQPDGDTPIGDLVLSSNTLYGVTQAGGSNRDGSIFSFTFGSTTDAVLHSFGDTSIVDDGQFPAAGLVLSGNVLYGTTEDGGTNGGSSGGHSFGGTIFRINTDGSGYRVLHSFSGANNGDGFDPAAPLLLVSNNTLYGTTESAGPGNGTLFCIGTNGANYQILHGFGTNFDDGSAPLAGLVLDGTTFYGTTSGGGTNGDGTVFSYDLGNANYQVLYSFSGTPDGNDPEGRLVLSGNTLYGASVKGGIWTDNNSSGNGTIFSICTNGNGYIVLRSLGSIDTGLGASPAADLIVRVGVLYGTTRGEAISGGGNGMVFSISTNGIDFNDIHDFTNNPDGANPAGGLCSP